MTPTLKTLTHATARRRQRPDTALPATPVTWLRPRPSLITAPDQPGRREQIEQREPVPPRRGPNRPYAGRAPIAPPPATHRASTGQLAGLYPFCYGGGLPQIGPLIGTDLITGAGFSFHPIELLHRGVITNPNILVTGNPGIGKSTISKTLALRLMAYGVKTLILGDLKNEYAPLARALGVEPVELGPGLPARLNPLDAGPLGEHLPADPVLLRERLDEIHRRRLMLLTALLETTLERRLSPTEQAALSLAIGQAADDPCSPGTGDPTIPQVWSLLRDPTDAMAQELRVREADAVREMIRPVADALRAMVTGALSGLFDGPTTVGLDFTAPIQTIDLSRLDGRGEQTIALTLACVSSWGQAAIDDPAGGVRLVVRDELWRAMRIPALVRKLDADLRLSRAQGTIQLLTTHRLADFQSVGAAGSPEAAIAANLLASCDTRICLAQDTAPLAAAKDAIGLSETECAHIASWGAAHLGRGLWKIGRHSQLVALRLTDAEREWTYTNQRMA